MHTDPGFPLTVGKGCTIGHRAVLHGCTIGDEQPRSAWARSSSTAPSIGSEHAGRRRRAGDRGQGVSGAIR